MTDEETKVYLRQHWDLYVAEETFAAYCKAALRLHNHVFEMACKEVAQNFIDGLILELKKGRKP